LITLQRETGTAMLVSALLDKQLGLEIMFTRRRASQYINESFAMRNKNGHMSDGAANAHEVS